MRQDKESSRPCPSCLIALPRANFRSYLEKCRTCLTTMCRSCTYAGQCNDCFTTETREMARAEYYIEKYGRVTA